MAAAPWSEARLVVQWLIMHPHTSAVAVVFGLIILWMVLLDAFETVVLPGGCSVISD